MKCTHPVQRQRTVEDVLAEEKTRLLPLPPSSIPTELVTSAPADKTALVTFDTNRYSVPHERPTAPSRSSRAIRLLDRDRVVATHVRSWSKNTTVEDPAHRKVILAHKPGVRDGKGRDRLHADELLRLWLEDGRNIGSLIARTIKLLDLYGAKVVAAAVDDLLARGSRDFGALAILCEQRRTKPRRVLPVELCAHVVDRDVIPHDLGGYDDDGE